MTISDTTTRGLLLELEMTRSMRARLADYQFDAETAVAQVRHRS